MHVEVENGLPGGRADINTDIVAVRVKPLIQFIFHFDYSVLSLSQSRLSFFKISIILLLYFWLLI